jgi:hypothetical protein
MAGSKGNCTDRSSPEQTFYSKELAMPKERPSFAARKARVLRIVFDPERVRATEEAAQRLDDQNPNPEPSTPLCVNLQ